MDPSERGRGCRLHVEALRRGGVFCIRVGGEVCRASRCRCPLAPRAADWGLVGPVGGRHCLVRCRRLPAARPAAPAVHSALSVLLRMASRRRTAALSTAAPPCVSDVAPHHCCRYIAAADMINEQYKRVCVGGTEREPPALPCMLRTSSTAAPAPPRWPACHLRNPTDGAAAGQMVCGFAHGQGHEARRGQGARGRGREGGLRHARNGCVEVPTLAVHDWSWQSDC